MLAPLALARSFRGQRTTANGGYAAGLLAQLVDTPAVEVTRRLPPHLEHPLTVSRDGERGLLHDGDALVAAALPRDPAVTASSPPSFAEAAEASRAVGGLAAIDCPGAYALRGDGREPRREIQETGRPAHLHRSSRSKPRSASGNEPA